MKKTKAETVGTLLCLLLPLTAGFSVSGQTPTDMERHRRSASGCSKDAVENLVKSTKETCSQMAAIDKYTSNIKSRQSLSIPSVSNHYDLRSILHQYNGDLSTAQKNCKPWRSGDSVVKSLTTMVTAVRDFEPKLQEEFRQSEIRVKTLIVNHKDIVQVEEKIAALREEIRKAQEIAEHSAIPQVQTHIQNDIKNKEENINSIMKEHNVVQGRRELVELKKSLEFAKGMSMDVENKANAARSKITTFREKMLKDSSALKRHHRNAQNGIKKLQEETRNNNNDINSNKQSISQLRTKMSQENNQISNLRNEIANAQRQMREMDAHISRSFKRASKRRRFGSWFRFVPIVGWVVGSKMYNEAKRRQHQLNDMKTRTINEHNRMIVNLHSHIATRNAEISSHQRRINSLEAKSKQFHQELQQFRQLDTNLKSVESQVNGILPSLSNAINSISKMRTTFEDIDLSLSDAIQRIKDDLDEAEISNVRYFVYNKISELKCMWNSASSKISSVGQCN